MLNIMTSVAIIAALALADAPPAPSSVPVLKTGQTESYAQGDDGFYAKGADRSYTRNNNGVVHDSITGLSWQDNVTGGYTMTQSDALAHCETLVLDNHSNWRLPSIRELRTLVDSSKETPAVDDVFENIPDANTYWSSTYLAEDPTHTWRLFFAFGGATPVSYNIMCVSGGVGGD